MRPRLTPKSSNAMGILSRKNPQNCDLFEQTVGQKIAKLSMDIESGNNAMAELEDRLKDTRETLTKSVGEYVGWCDALASYYETQASQAKGEAGVPVAAPGGTMKLVQDNATKQSDSRVETPEKSPEADRFA